MATGELESFADIPDPIRQAPARPGSIGPPGAHLSGEAPTTSAPTEPSPTRSQSARRRWIAVAVGAAWIGALLAAHLGVRADLFTAPVVAQLVVWVIALPLGLALALRPRANGWPPGVPLVRAGLVVLVAAFVGLAVIPVDGPQAPLRFDTVSVCLSFAVVLALPALVGAALVLRGAFLNAPALRGAMVGAVCGLAGTAGIHAHCPVVTPSHVLLAHGPPILLFAALGAAIGMRRGRV